MHNTSPITMKSTYFCQFIALSLVLSIGLLGCKKSPKPMTVIPGKTGPPVGGGSTPSGPATGPGPGAVVRPDDGTRTGLVTRDGLTPQAEQRPSLADFNEDPETLKQQTVYFDLDKSTIKASEQGKLQSVADFMKRESRTWLKIEGHCDERGTAEYNRSLGERRALAAREYLISSGIPGERITTLSYGEDKPADPGHDEAAWAKNRRAEFIVLRPKQ